MKPLRLDSRCSLRGSIRLIPSGRRAPQEALHLLISIKYAQVGGAERYVPSRAAQHRTRATGSVSARLRPIKPIYAGTDRGGAEQRPRAAKVGETIHDHKGEILNQPLAPVN